MVVLPAAQWVEGLTAASGNGTVLVGWSEAAPDGRRVVRVVATDAAGTPRGLPVSMPSQGQIQQSPAVAFDGVQFLVVWVEPSNTLVRTPTGDRPGSLTFGARVAADGRLLDSVATPLLENAGAPDVAWNGTAWVVVGTGRAGAVARRLSPAGIVLDPRPVGIPTGGGTTHRNRLTMREPGSAEELSGARISCNAADCLVLWHASAYGRSSRPGYGWVPLRPPEVRSIRIGPDLQPIDPRTVSLFPPGIIAVTSVSWNAESAEWAVVVSNGSARRVGADGVPLDQPSDEPGWFHLSAIPERSGWRIAWAKANGRAGIDAQAIFHGWTRSGKLADVAERWQLTDSADSVTQPELVDLPDPLIVFVRGRNEDGTIVQQIVAKSLEDSRRLATSLVLHATRIDEQTLLLSWFADIEEIISFTIEEWSLAAWQWGAPIEGSLRAHRFPLLPGRAARLRVVAYSPSGRIVSNVIEIHGDRERTAGR